MRHLHLLLAVAVVLAANVFVLAGVAFNRAGEPEAVVELTERELRLTPRDEENTGIALRLVSKGIGFREELAWLDQAKLEELGFDSRRPRVPPKEAYVVLERQQSGLAAVDAGRDAAALRRRYPDPKRFLITRCWVRLPWGQDRPHGVIPKLMVAEIHVPLPHSRMLRGLAPTPASGAVEPRYAVTLCCGKRHEPWVCGCRLLAGARGVY